MRKICITVFLIFLFPLSFKNILLIWLITEDLPSKFLYSDSQPKRIRSWKHNSSKYVSSLFTNMQLQIILYMIQETAEIVDHRDQRDETTRTTQSCQQFPPTQNQATLSHCVLLARITPNQHGESLSEMQHKASSSPTSPRDVKKLYGFLISKER